MNVQAQMSGQISGQVPGQAASQLPGLVQQNVSSAPNQRQGLGGHRNAMNMESDLINARKFMQQKIFQFVLRRVHQTRDTGPKKIQDAVRNLEIHLFKTASTMEEYLNQATLENRLITCIQNSKKSSSRTCAHQGFGSSSSSIGTMIPTPGMPYSGNSNSTKSSSANRSLSAVSGSNSIAPATGNGSSLLSNIKEPFGGIQGSMGNGYPQVPANFSTKSSANNTVSSIREQRMTSQMIPTPGFNNTNTGAASTAESPAVSRPQQCNQLVRAQNSRTMQSLGSNSGSRVMPGLQQRSCSLQNGVLNGGSKRMRGPSTGSETSEGFQLAANNGNSPKPSQRQYDQHQLTMPRGDVYKMSAPDSSGRGNVFGPVTSASSAPNNQNLNSANLSATSTNSSLKTNQLNVNRSQQAAHILSQSTDTSNKLNFQCANTLQQNLLLSNQQDFCRKPHPSQQHQFIHDQSRQKPQNQQHEALVKNEPFSDSEFISNLSNQLNPDCGMQCNSNDLLSKVSEQFQCADLRNELLLSSAADHSRGSQMVSLPPIVQHISSSPTQMSQQMQLLHSQVAAVSSQDDASCPSAGLQEEMPLSDQWHTKLQEGFESAVDMVHEQHLQEDFRRRITVQDEARCNNLSSETSTCQVNTETANPPSENKSITMSGDPTRGVQFLRQTKWILLLSHARNCPMPEGKCPERYCVSARHALRHIESCNLSPCPRPHCNDSRKLLIHKRQCQDPVCPVCSLVMKVKERQMRLHALADSKPNLLCSASSQCNTYDGGVAVESSDDAQHSLKRIKTEQSSQSLLPGNKTSATFIQRSDLPTVFHDTQHQDYQQGVSCLSMKAMVVKARSEVLSNTGYGNPSITDLKKESMDYTYNQNHVSKQIVHGDSFSAQQDLDQSNTRIPCIKFEADLDQSKPRKCNTGYENTSRTDLKKESMDYTYNQNSVGKQIIHGDSFSAQQECIKVETDLDQSKPRSVAPPVETGSVIMSGKPKIKGVSMMELFTPEQVREHMMSLRQWVGQTKTKAEKNQAMGHSMSENSCQLCAVERLAFEPPPIYCTPCGARIKRNAVYYTVGAGETRNCFCIPCSNDTRGDTILVDGTAMSRERLERRKNDEETEEAWVQCDKCEAWQHQICALFNWRRNDGGQAEYTCPNCYLAEVEKGERTPLPQTAVLGAKDLPRTILSDHIEERLFRRLKQERQERARLQGMSYDEVPGAEALVIRVVSSVDKKLEVKQQFLEIFKENYPTEFPYKSKVVLLFQKIEGVEVCLFGMYVQEFGSECQQPNHRRVYLSYLDSVKYFRPDIKAVTGEALRTFVYHEILIGYLEYCKKRGFTSCYIWACPPLKGEDYILYCHPEIQKTPKSDKLREWYLSMLRKASKENIVVDVMNLYDNFFVTNGERKTKVTASRLPYFDGDYWPGAAEEMICQLRQEEDGRKQHKKGTIKKTLTKRALRASGQYDLSGNASIDLLLMHKLGETINPMKEDFIMVHLQHACTHCGVLMVSGNRWVCNQCKNFQLCDKCYQAEQKVEDRERHPINQKSKHLLHQIEISDVPEETRDKDNILESEFFDTRQAFLSLCQGNHYQYDTLRRAKHSSMMVLYHLHNPTAPAFATTCNICQLDVEAGQGWRCEVCPDYDVCNTCYQRDGGINHPHKLANHPSMADCDAQNGEAREMRVAQLKKMLELLVHASHCRSTTCQYPNCRRVKGLFRHGIHCKIRASGGCKTCQKMWHLLQLHARACKVSECTVPRCRDLKVHLRRAQQHSESRRRAAVKEMMRQRAAEVAGNVR